MKKLLVILSVLIISIVSVWGQTLRSNVAISYAQTTVANQDKLDIFLTNVSNMKNQLNNDTKYQNLLDTVTSKLNELWNKYSSNTVIVEMINYLKKWLTQMQQDFVKNKDVDSFFCELNGTCSENNKIDTATSSQTPTTTNTGTQNKCSFDECLSNDFYVIKSTNTYYPDGCNSEGLKNPEDLCILKIGKMYVAPKNFTFVEKPSNDYTKSLVKDNRVNSIKNTYIIHSTPSTWPSCHDVLTQVDVKYNRFTPEWDTSKSSDFFAEREYVRNNSPECKALDNAASIPDPNSGKIQLVANPQTCGDLLNQIVPEKKWNLIDEFGWDGWNKNCTTNNSNKNWLCALELNTSKLQLYTDKPYYVGQNILKINYSSEYQMYDPSVSNSFFATYLWDWKLLTVTPIYEKKVNYSASMIQWADGSYTWPMVNGRFYWYALPESANGLYQVCVWY